jgi:hypothetical protein
LSELITDLAMELDEGVIEEKCSFELVFEEAPLPSEL